MNKIYLKVRSCLPWQLSSGLILLLLGFSLAGSAQNYVESGAGMVNFGTIGLTTSGATSYWGTDRTANPGYFVAVGTATYTAATDVNFNVKGQMKWYATASGQSCTAPVGDEVQLRSLTISGSTASGDIFATSWWTGSASNVSDPTAPNTGKHSITSLGAGLASVSSAGFWDWQDISGTGAGRTITVDIPDLTGFSTAANLRLVGWNGTHWVNLSGATGATGNTNHSTLSGTMLAGITAIAIGATITAPVATTPDLRPYIIIPNPNFSPTNITRPFTVLIRNMRAGTVASSLITIRLYKPTPASTISLTGQAAADWTIVNSGSFYTLTTNVDIAASPTGYSITANVIIPPATAPGTYPLRAFIPNLSGGELLEDNFNNNIIVDLFKN